MPYAAVNELSMYYEVHGDGPPMLLLHGGSGSIPEKWIVFFTLRFRVIAPEQMGHGRTADLVDRPFHYHDLAEDTVELMRELGVESAVVVGYSDGGHHRPRHGDPSPRARDQARGHRSERPL